MALFSPYLSTKTLARLCMKLGMLAHGGIPIERSLALIA
jgi:type II secretory pathway component PulF